MTGKGKEKKRRKQTARLVKPQRLAKFTDVKTSNRNQLIKNKQTRLKQAATRQPEEEERERER